MGHRYQLIVVLHLLCSLSVLLAKECTQSVYIEANTNKTIVTESCEVFSGCCKRQQQTLTGFSIEGYRMMVPDQNKMNIHLPCMSPREEHLVKLRYHYNCDGASVSDTDERHCKRKHRNKRKCCRNNIHSQDVNMMVIAVEMRIVCKSCTDASHRTRNTGEVKEVISGNLLKLTCDSGLRDSRDNWMFFTLNGGEEIYCKPNLEEKENHHDWVLYRNTTNGDCVLEKNESKPEDEGEYHCGMLVEYNDNHFDSIQSRSLGVSVSTTSEGESNNTALFISIPVLFVVIVTILGATVAVYRKWRGKNDLPLHPEGEAAALLQHYQPQQYNGCGRSDGRRFTGSSSSKYE